MKTFQALVKKEILDGKNGYLRAPVILAGISIVLLLVSALGFGNMVHFDGMEKEGIGNLSDALNKLYSKKPEEMGAAVTIGYWGMAFLPWVAFPFVVFFSLLSSLYEERRDRSILFWKSMPVADWQEVLAKFFVPVVVAPIIFLGVVVAAQLMIALVMSFVVLFQGGPVLELWPLGWMIGTWIAGLGQYYVSALWMLPMLAWVLLVSAYANRMPFLWAILIPAILVAIEAIFFETAEVLRWIAIHMGGWSEYAFGNYHDKIDGPRDLLTTLMGGPQIQALSYTLTNVNFWVGVIIAAGFVFAAIEIRKKAT